MIGASVLCAAASFALAPLPRQVPDVSAPRLEIVAPQSDEYVSGTVTIHARLVPLAAERNVRRMSFFVDGTGICTVERAPFQCSWNAGKVVRAHQVRVVVELAGGQRLVRTIRTKGIDHQESSSVTAIQVPTTVTRGGRYVPGLKAAQFTVFEANQRQTITGFAAETSDVTLVLALDTSGSMEAALETVKAYAKDFLEPLPAGWPVTVLSFDDRVYTVAQVASTTAERSAAIDRLKAFGGTALFSAVIKALEQVEAAVGRKAIVVFTDGDDRSSTVNAAELRRVLEASDAVLYFVTAGEAARSPATLTLLGDLAEISGGRVLRGHDRRSLRDAFDEVREEIRHQYLLTYVPARLEKPGTWRALSVKVECGGCRVRSRIGYRVAAPGR